MKTPLWPEQKIPEVSSHATRRSRRIMFLSVFLSLVLFLLDALTPQRLVVSILQDVPIALTGLTRDRRLTFAMVLFGILSNVLAEAINARTEGSVSPVAIANRLFSVVSFLLVGYLALRIQDNALETGKAISEQLRSDRDRKIRSLLEELSREEDLQNLLSRIATHFRSLFGASGIIFAAARENRWHSPILSDPSDLSFWKEGEPLPGALSLLMPRPFPPRPISELSLAFVLESNHVREGIVARLSAGSKAPEETSGILLFLLDPREPEAALLLEEILPVLEELLRRLELLRHLKETNALLLRKNVLIRDLISGLSHDIRTPLLAQNMNMTLALEGVWGAPPEGVASLMGQMIQSNSSLLELSNRLLLLSRYELDALPLERQAFPLDALLSEVLTELEPISRQRGLTLSTHLLPDVFLGDRQALKRLFLNLVDNAIKWSPPGGTVGVSCCKEPSGFLVTISDSGPGIPPEMIPRLFRRFGGLSPGSGFGLGLYLAQQIARLHGGRIHYQKGDPGSLFTVELPEGSLP